MTSDPEPDQAPTAAYDMAIWQLAEQLRSVDALDNKAGAVITAALALAGLFGASIPFAIDSDVPESAVVAVVGAALVLVAFACTLFYFRCAVGTTSWMHGPDARYLIEVAGQYPEDRVRLWMAERVVDSYVINDPMIADKARCFNRALSGVIAQGTLAAAALIATAVTAAVAG